jgi:TonB family protein
MYVLHVSIIWVVLYLSYYFGMKRLTFFQNNRFFLVSSLILGLLLPLLAPLLIIDKPEVFTLTVAEVSTIELFSLKVPEKSIDWHVISKMFLKLIYLLGVGFMLVRLVNGLWKIFQLYKTGEKVKRGELIFAYNDKPHLPFSFMNVIFLSRNVDFGDRINKVITHEIAHVKQWHSIDVLMTEILQVFFWFNPILIFYKKSLKDAHEYIADRTVVSQSDYKEYVRLLLQTTSSPLEDHLVNSFFNSQIKSRIAMLNINKSNRKAALRYAIIIPMIGLFTYLLASSKMISDHFQVEVEQENNRNILAPLPPNFKPDSLLWDNSESYYDGWELKITNKRVDGSFDLTDYIMDIKANHATKKVEIKLVGKKNPTGKEQVIEDFEIRTGVLIVDLNESNWKNGQLTKNNHEFILVDKKVNGKIDILGELKAIQYSADGKTTYIRLTSENGEILFNEQNLINGDQRMTKDSIYKIVKEMPRFPGCENLNLSIKEKEDCSKERLLQFLGNAVKYPAQAKNGGIEGQAVVQFTVSKNGSIEDVIVLRDPGAGMGDAAKQAVLDMNTLSQKWIPGKHEGKIVNVQYTVPLKFKLNDKDQNIVLINNGTSNTEIVKYPEVMPLYPGCDLHTGNILDKYACANKLFVDYVIKNSSMKEEAFMRGALNGSVSVSFIVKKDGSIEDVKVVRDFAKLGKTITDAILKLNEDGVKFTPGKNNGKPIDVEVSFPFVIKNGDTANTYDKTNNDRIVLSKEGDKWAKNNEELGNKSNKSKLQSITNKERVYWLLENKPRFPGCEYINGGVEVRQKCAMEKMLDFTHSALKYPKEVLEKDLEGSVIVDFVVTKTGNVKDVEVNKDPGYGMAKAAKEAVLAMNKMSQKWIPALHNGEAVNSRYTTTIFFLNKKNREAKKVRMDALNRNSISERDKKVIISEEVEYYVDGKQITKKQFTEISPSDIVSTDNVKEWKGGKMIVKILALTKSPKKSQNDLSLKVYPNPSPKDKISLNIVSTDTRSSAIIKVYDVKGKLLHNQTVDVKSGNVTIELNLAEKAINLQQLLIIVQQGDVIQHSKIMIN